MEVVACFDLSFRSLYGYL